MELTVTQRRENALLDRTEVYFSAEHANEATPSRAELRRALAAVLNAKDATVVLDWARSEYGRTVTQGYAKVYKSKERAIALETTPILRRNGLVAAPAKPEAPKEEAPPKEEKPAKKEPPEPPKKEEKKAEKKEAPEKEAPKPKKAAKEEAPPKEEKPAKKEAPKEKKAAKKEGK